MRPTPRSQAVGAFYAANARDLLHALRRAVGGPDALIEDACSYAWMQLLRCEHVALDADGFRWLYVVAIHEGYRLSDRGRRDIAAGAPTELTLRSESLDLQIDRRERFRESTRMLGELRPRQARMVLLHASGFSYAEIATITGDSLLTVERQLLRGKRALRRQVEEQAA